MLPKMETMFRVTREKRISCKTNKLIHVANNSEIEFCAMLNSALILVLALLHLAEAPHCLEEQLQT